MKKYFITTALVLCLIAGIAIGVHLLPKPAWADEAFTVYIAE